MNFSTLITDFSELINLDIKDATILTNVKRWLNHSYKDFQARYRWSWKERTGYFQTIKVYETGTVSVTENSRTVTGSGTTWTSAMIGRFFRVEGTLDWYKIIAVGSGTSLTLDMPYIRDTASESTYKIWKKYYPLFPDVDELVDIYIDPYPRRLIHLPFRGAPVIFNGWLQGLPTRYKIFERDRAVTTYTTGTVSGTINTKTLTGDSTSWIGNVYPGDKLTVGNYTYNILTVDSDTQVTLVQNLMATISASTTYSAERENRILAEFNLTPKDYNRNVKFTYYQRAYDLINDNDKPNVPERWQPIILLGAEWIAYKAADDTREGQALTIYEGKVNEIRKQEIGGTNQPQGWTWSKR